MKLSFQKLIDKKNLLDSILKEYNLDPIELTKMDWGDALYLNLGNVYDASNLFYKKRKDKLELLLGNGSITFKDLKSKLILESNSLYKKMEVLYIDHDWEDSTNELDLLKSISNRCLSITESDFSNVFSSYENYRSMFPYLWTSEVSLNDELFSEIFNYLCNNNIEVFDNITEEYDYEDTLSKIRFDGEYYKLHYDKKSNAIDLSKEIINKINNYGKPIDIDVLLGRIKSNYKNS